DRKRVRIPFEEHVVLANRLAVLEQDARAVNDVVAFFFAAPIVDDGQDARTIHRDQLAPFGADVVDADELHEAVGLGFLLRLFSRAGRCAADVERTHGQLRSGLADGLRRDDPDRFAALHHASGREVAAVAELADAAARLAGQHRANLHAVAAGL